MELTWLGHSALALKVASGEVALIDPFFEGNPSYPKDYAVDRCDAILLTHGHGDHLGDTAALAKRFSPQVVAIHELAVWLEGQGTARTVGMNKGGTADLGFLRATMTHAQHSSSTAGNLYLGEAAGFSEPRFEKLRDRNIKWKNRKHTVPLLEGRLWMRG